MKRTIAAIAAAMALISAGTIYPETMKVTSIQGGIARMETSTGHIYEMDAEDYEVDDLVSLIMFDNGTPEVMDDIILSARYAGQF